jgi:fructokinase
MEQPDAVVVIGESLIDVVETATGDIVETPGGSPLNVAVTLGRLGVHTYLLSALGDDERADRIAAHLAESAVTLLPGARQLSRTSTASARMQADGSALYDFDVAWEPAETDLPPARAVHAGSLALFLQPGGDLVRGWLRRSAGALVTLDPNIRPSLLPDRDAVVDRFEDLLPLAHVVKLSDEDADWLYAGVDEPEVVQRLLDLGPTLVVLTRGARGCVLTCRDAALEVPVVPTAVVDTIGAGDSFMGALIHQILVRNLDERLSARRSLRPAELALLGGAAAGVAAVTVGRRGADPPRIADLVLGPEGLGAEADERG